MDGKVFGEATRRGGVVKVELFARPEEWDGRSEVWIDEERVGDILCLRGKMIGRFVLDEKKPLSGKRFRVLKPGTETTKERAVDSVFVVDSLLARARPFFLPSLFLIPYLIFLSLFLSSVRKKG